MIISIWSVFLEVLLSLCHLPGEETARGPFIQGMRGVFIVKFCSGNIDSSSEKDKGTKGQRDKGTKGQQYKSTKVQ